MSFWELWLNTWLHVMAEAHRYGLSLGGFGGFGSRSTHLLRE